MMHRKSTEYVVGTYIEAPCSVKYNLRTNTSRDCCTKVASPTESYQQGSNQDKGNQLGLSMQTSTNFEIIDVGARLIS